MMTELAQKAVEELQKLSDSQQDVVALRLLDIIETEEYLFDDDDESDVAEILNQFVREDGTIDYEKLDAESITITLDELNIED